MGSSDLGVAAVVLNALFALFAAQVALRSTVEGDRMLPEKRLFKYSIFYLFLMFAALVADRWLA